MECSRLMTLVFCSFSMFYCLGLAFAVLRINRDAGFACLAVFGLWNAYLLWSTWRAKVGFNPFVNCLSSCLSVMILLAASFKFVSRYHYYGRWPTEYPNGRVGGSSLKYHKMGLILIVSGIPLMYKCECQFLANDKEIIYTILADFFDIYELADVLALGSPACERVGSNYGTYNRRPDRFHCTESTHSSMKEGGSMEGTVQGFCTFSFVIFVVIYLEALGTGLNNTTIESLKSYIKPLILIQDIPFFCIRISVWAQYGFQPNQFLFLVKNVISASLTTMDLIFSFFQSLAQPDEGQPDEGQQGNAEQQINRGSEDNP